MITIIHGDDIVLSRKKIDEFFSSSSWVVKVDANRDRFNELSPILESGGLFSQSKTILIEYVSKFKKEELKLWSHFFKQYETGQNIHIILWDDRKIDNELLLLTKKTNIFFYELPKHFYQFLDNIRPKNGKLLTSTLLELTKTTSPELIFYSMVKRVRHLMIAKTGRYKDFTETSKMQDWQAGKLKTQSSYWQEEQLKEFYHKLFQLEVDLKTSNLPMPLEKSIDFLLVTL